MNTTTTTTLKTYRSHFFSNAGLGVHLKPLVRTDVHLHLPRFKRKFPRQILGIRVHGGNGPHLLPFVPLHQFR